jgi:hypothetical protein
MGKQDNQTATYRVDTESGRSDEADSVEVVTEPVKTWRGYIWDTWELPREERWLLFKLDAFILTFASVRPSSISRFSALTRECSLDIS